MQGPPNRLWTGLAASTLIACFVMQAIFSMKDKSVTVDEITYIAAGYYHLQTGDFHYNMTNPPLSKILAGLPLLLFDTVELPELESDPDGWNAIEEWQYGRRFLYENAVDADELLFAARLPFVALGAILGFLVFVWASQLYGRTSGLLSLFAYSFSPNLLAHTRLTTQDFAVTLIVFSSAYFFWRYTTKRSLPALFASAIIVGCGIITKSTAGFVAPAFGLYFLIAALKSSEFGVDERFPWVARIRGDEPRKRQLLTAIWIAVTFGVAFLIVVNIGYGFQGTLSGVPLLPSAFVKSIFFQLRLSSFGGVYLAGEIYPNSLWYIILVTLFLKTPIPILIGAALSGFCLAIHRRSWEGELLIVSTISVFVALFMLLNNLGTILRYVLPIFPFLFVLIGRLASERTRYRPALLGTGAILCIWYLAGTFSTSPHYLAYFNEFAGGPENGHRLLAESNLDWGQDLKGLKAYMDEKGIDRIQLGYFGSADANYYGIDYDYLPSVGLAPKEPGQLWWFEIDPEQVSEDTRPSGLMAVSVTLIQGPRWLGRLFEPTYGWLSEHEPIATIGHTIHIYDIPEPTDP